MNYNEITIVAVRRLVSQTEQDSGAAPSFWMDIAFRQNATHLPQWASVAECERNKPANVGDDTTKINQTLKGNETHAAPEM